MQHKSWCNESVEIKAMSRSRTVLRISCLFLALILGWFLRGVFDESVKNSGRSPEQAVRDSGKTGGSFSPTPQAPLSRHGSAESAAGAFRGLHASPGNEVARRSPLPEAALPAVEIPPGLGRGEIEIDPFTGVLRFTPSEANATQISPPAPPKPPDVHSDAIEVDPATGKIRFLKSPSAEAGLPTPKTVETQNANTTNNSPVVKKTER